VREQDGGCHQEKHCGGKWFQIAPSIAGGLIHSRGGLSDHSDLLTDRAHGYLITAVTLYCHFWPSLKLGSWYDLCSFVNSAIWVHTLVTGSRR
jgi:hypothetical protein